MMHVGDQGWVASPAKWAGAYVEVVSIFEPFVTVRSLRQYENGDLFIHEGEPVTIYQSDFIPDDIPVAA
jgi:hypothetical protein